VKGFDSARVDSIVVFVGEGNKKKKRSFFSLI